MSKVHLGYKTTRKTVHVSAVDKGMLNFTHQSQLDINSVIYRKLDIYYINKYLTFIDIKIDCLLSAIRQLPESLRGSEG